MEKKTVVLVVDDNPTSLSVLFEYLEEAGLEIAVARSGERALEHVESVQPDLILLDVMMSGIDGFETCRRLKEQESTRRIPVIFLTSLTDSVNKVKGFLAGGDDYLTKPLQYEEVLARIGAQLRIRKLEQQVQDEREQVILEQHSFMQRQQALLAEQERLQRLQALHERLLTNISYDLQYPLNKLIGIVRMFAERLDDLGKAEIKGELSKLHVSAEDVYAIHENLILWASYQRNLLEYAPEQINLYDIITYNILRFSPVAEKRKITLSSSIPEQMLVFADYHMIDAIIRNLLSNALKFTAMEGRVRIAAIEVEDTVEISIADTGVGLPKEKAAALFEVEPTTSPGEMTKEERSGLGLLLCKFFIEKNRGAIWCTSEIGMGATFTFRLPKTPKNV